MRSLCALMIFAFSCSCHLFLSYEPAGEQRVDAAHDAHSIDAAHDAHSIDAPHDAGLTAPFDVRPDAPLDALVEGIPDALPPDQRIAAAETSPVADSGPIGQPACAPGITNGAGWLDKTMQTCFTQTTIDQCDAEALCNVAGGWQLCTAREYLARGGSSSDAGADYAWIKSCVRSNGSAPTKPTNALCAECSHLAETNNQAEVGWPCESSTAQYTLPFYDIGVRTDSSCLYLGQLDPATAGFWAPLATGNLSLVKGAVCCSS